MFHKQQSPHFREGIPVLCRLFVPIGISFLKITACPQVLSVSYLIANIRKVFVMAKEKPAFIKPAVFLSNYFFVESVLSFLTKMETIDTNVPAPNIPANQGLSRYSA